MKEYERTKTEILKFNASISLSWYNNSLCITDGQHRIKAIEHLYNEIGDKVEILVNLEISVHDSMEEVTKEYTDLNYRLTNVDITDDGEIDHRKHKVDMIVNGVKERFGEGIFDGKYAPRGQENDFRNCIKLSENFEDTTADDFLALIDYAARDWASKIKIVDPKRYDKCVSISKYPNNPFCLNCNFPPNDRGNSFACFKWVKYLFRWHEAKLARNPPSTRANRLVMRTVGQPAVTHRIIRPTVNHAVVPPDITRRTTTGQGFNLPVWGVNSTSDLLDIDHL